MIALIFGVVATWLNYRLNIDVDLERHLAEVRETAESQGARLATLSERLVGDGNRELLQQDLAAISKSPGVAIAGVVDEAGTIIADSTGTLRGQPARSTALAMAASLISPSGESAVQHGGNPELVFSAHPFLIHENQNGWVLIQFDRTAAIDAAKADALAQLRWMASAMALLSFILWAVLHLGFAGRLGQLADSVRAFGESHGNIGPLPQGGDEVGELSAAFSGMATKVREREREQMRLEREVLEISENEQRRIGRDLHDGIGQRLTAASLATNAAVTALRKDGSAHAERIAEIGQQLREAITETRALSHGLAPVGLAEDGLPTALASLAENACRTGTARCVFEQAGSVRISDQGAAGHLYRIAQEAVTNALKHASASEIRIGLEQRNDLLVLEVEDDGEGIEEAPAGIDGVGLRIMRYRAKLISADLEIGSAPAGGTRVSCRVKMPA